MADPIKIRVRNFIGLEKVDVELDGILLVAGLNGAGKSSLIEAVGCAVAGGISARGVKTKGAAKGLLHDGADAGSVTIETSRGRSRISLPAGEYETNGEAIRWGSPEGVNARQFLALDGKKRAEIVGTLFGTAPTATDLHEWFLKNRPDAAVPEKAIDALWGKIDANGWDATYGAAREHSTKLKGAWEQITKENWGEKKAGAWCPTVLEPDEVYDYNEALVAHETAQKAMEGALQGVAVAKSEIERLTTEAGRVPAIKGAIAEAEEARDVASQQLENLAEEKAAEEVVVDQETMPQCPHCQKWVQFKKDKSGYTFLVKGPEKFSTAAQIKASRERHQRIDQAIRKTQDEFDRLTRAIAAETLALEAAEAAAVKLEEVEGQPEVDEATIAAAREGVAKLQRKAEAIKAREDAKALFAKYEQHAAIIASLAPEGTRKEVFGKKIAGINKLLNEFSVTAKMGAIEMDSDINVTYDGRAYGFLSESERWRVDLVVAAMLGQQEDAKLILVDRLDVLAPQSRPGVLQLLRHLGIPALVTMTAKALDAVPDLEKARFGETRWLEAGTLKSKQEMADA